MPDQYSAKDIQGLWEEQRSTFARSRRNIQLVRRWLANEVPPEVPEDFQAQVDLRLHLPIAITTSAHTIQLLSRKTPSLRRIPLGKGIAPQRKSTRIEQWATALPKQLEAQGGPLWRPWVEGLFSHGEAGLVCTPDMAHWEHFPETGDPQHQRDTKGRDPEDDYFAEPGKRRTFKLDDKQTAAAYHDYTADWKSRRLPLVARVVPADQCVPLFGPNFRLDGLLIQSEYSEYSLKRKGYSWIGGDRMLSPGQASDAPHNGFTRTRSLLELHTPGKVCYWVGSKPEPVLDSKGKTEGYTVKEVYDTQKGGQPAEIDLEAEYGMERLHAYYGYGAHWAIESDPDRRALPFLYAFTSALHFLNSVVNAKGVQMWNRAFGQDYIEIDPAIMENAPSLIAGEDGAPRKIPRQPNIAQYVGGRVVRGYDTTNASDVNEMITMLLGTIKDEAPSAAVFGGEGASSGHDRTLIRAFLEMAYHDVLDGGLNGWQWLAQTGLEWASLIAKKNGTSVPLYVSADSAT